MFLLLLLLRIHKQIVGKDWQIDKFKFEQNVEIESTTKTQQVFSFSLNRKQKLSCVSFDAISQWQANSKIK